MVGISDWVSNIYLTNQANSPYIDR